MILDKLIKSFKSALARDISANEGIKYKSAQKRLQREIKQAKNKFKAEKEIIRKGKKSLASEIAEKENIKYSTARRKVRRQEKEATEIPPQFEDYEKLLEAIDDGEGVDIEMFATYDFYGSDVRERTVNFYLTAKEAKELKKISENGSCFDCAMGILESKSANAMGKNATITEVNEIKINYNPKPKKDDENSWLDDAF